MSNYKQIAKIVCCGEREGCRRGFLAEMSWAYSEKLSVCHHFCGGELSVSWFGVGFTVEAVLLFYYTMMI